jgi:hypothetical protein
MKHTLLGKQHTAIVATLALVAWFAFLADSSLGSLQLYWPLETGSGGTVFDAGDYGRDGTITGATWQTDVPLTLSGISTHSLGIRRQR